MRSRLLEYVRSSAGVATLLDMRRWAAGGGAQRHAFTCLAVRLVGVPAGICSCWAYSSVMISSNVRCCAGMRTMMHISLWIAI